MTTARRSGTPRPTQTPVRPDPGHVVHMMREVHREGSRIVRTTRCEAVIGTGDQWTGFEGLVTCPLCALPPKTVATY